MDPCLGYGNWPFDLDDCDRFRGRCERLIWNRSLEHSIDSILILRGKRDIRRTTITPLPDYYPSLAKGYEYYGDV